MPMITSVTKQTNQRLLHFRKESLERRTLCLNLSNPPSSRNGHGSIMIKQKTEPFCFVCMKALQVGKFKLCASKGKALDAFVTRGYTNWKDANGDK